jgi:hypothetical protein
MLSRSTSTAPHCEWCNRHRQGQAWAYHTYRKELSEKIQQVHEIIGMRSGAEDAGRTSS